MARRNSATRTDLKDNMFRGILSVMSRVDRKRLDSGSLHDNQFSGAGIFIPKTVRNPTVRKATRSNSE